MNDRIEPYGGMKRYDLLLGRGEYIPLEGKTFDHWAGYLSQVVDEEGGFRGTIIYIPNIEKDRLFTNG